MKLLKMNKKRPIALSAAGILILCLTALLLLAFPFSVKAEKMDLTKITLRIDDAKTVQVTAYEANYQNNLFLSLRSLADALTGTIAQFNFYTDADGAYQVVTGMPYDHSTEMRMEAPDGRIITAVPEETAYLVKGAYQLYKDGRPVTYYNFAEYVTDDLYISLLNAQLMLDLHIVYQDGIYYLDTGKHFQADLAELNARGYFNYLNGVAFGDATTGQLLFSCHGDRSVPIASTTKLMTYLVVKRMIELGKCSEEDYVTVSANASRLSVSDDAVLYMYEGEQILVKDLLNVMMVVSSNEAALALAEHVGGTKEHFVEMMNAMAFRLGLTSAVFYNPHGLPEYLPGDVSCMVENQMSAKDLFKLARTVLLKYPEVEEITSQETIWLENLWVSFSNTNSLIHNMPDVFGLKTGTTDAADKCLVSARRVRINQEEHILVAVVLGAEFNSDRVEMSELLLKSQGY